MAFGVVGKIIVGTAATSLTAAGALGLYLSNKPTNLREKLEQEGFKILGNNDPDWSKLVDKYKSASDSSSDTTSVPKKIKGLELTEPSIPEDSHKKSLQDECEKLLKTKIEDSDFQRKEQETKWWCIKDSDILAKS